MLFDLVSPSFEFTSTPGKVRVTYSDKEASILPLSRGPTRDHSPC